MAQRPMTFLLDGRFAVSGRLWLRTFSAWLSRTSPTGWWLLCVICLEAAFAISISVPLLLGQASWVSLNGPVFIPAMIALLLIPLALHAAWTVGREQHHERVTAAETAQLMDTFLGARHDWVWAVGTDGRFTFCSSAVRELLGYAPDDLLGEHYGQVIDLEELAAAAREAAPGTRLSGTEAPWIAFRVFCRHRNGARVPVEVEVRPRTDFAGRNAGHEGVIRPAAESGPGGSYAQVRSRVEDVLSQKTFRTAFQPIRCLETDEVIGVEALTRFRDCPDASPETRFTEAATVGLGIELDLLAVETALIAAESIIRGPYISLNLSPVACLDPRLPALLARHGVSPDRIVLEVTERVPVADYVVLAEALRPLRSMGVRIAVDDAGAGYASMRHILRLKPDIIKVDRSIISGINAEPGHRALGAAMVGLAAEINAALIAEGIETDAELRTVLDLGFGSGQGFLLGRPTTRHEDWRQWEGIGSIHG
ncbi:MAG: EAL domain-containing protein [Arthrobacter sp.]